MLQVYNRKIKYPKSLISGGSITTSYKKKILLPYYFFKSNLLNL